jgi:hypothetical protein
MTTSRQEWFGDEAILKPQRPVDPPPSSSTRLSQVLVSVKEIR